MSGDCSIKVGDELTIRVMRWAAGWEFDCPTAIIAPVHRYHEDGASIEHAVEDFLIDCCTNEAIPADHRGAWDWRGWDEAYLRRKFYRKGVDAAVIRVRFVADKHGQLSWEEVKLAKRGWA